MVTNTDPLHPSFFLHLRRRIRPLILCLLAISSICLSNNTRADLTLNDLVSPESSGMTPSDFATWFQSPTNTIGSTGEQVALIWQVCTGCSAYIDQSGGDNYGFIFQSVDGSIANILQGGGGRQGILQAGAAAPIAIIYQSPNSVGNIANINQSGGLTVTNWR